MISSIAILVNLCVTLYLILRGKRTMADISRLEAKIAAIEAVVPKIQGDYQALFDLIQQLRDQIDNPQLQADIDALEARLNGTLLSLTALDESVPEEPAAPEEPVA